MTLSGSLPWDDPTRDIMADIKASIEASSKKPYEPFKPLMCEGEIALLEQEGFYVDRERIQIIPEGYEFSMSEKQFDSIAIVDLPRVRRTNLYYRLWLEVKSRCTNPNHHGYKNYGGRGIALHEEWLDYDIFIRDILNILGPRPVGGTLDRTDNNKNYCPDNIRWATKSVQRNNRRPTQVTGQIPYRGVCAAKQKGMFQAQGQYKGTHVNLGYHTTIEDAALAYDTWAITVYGPTWSGLNFKENNNG